MRTKSIRILLVIVIIAVISCIGTSAVSEYNTYSNGTMFTLKGSLEGTKSDRYYIDEYGTVSIEKNAENPTYSRLLCTVHLFAMKNGIQLRVDNSEVLDTVVTTENYAGTSKYTFTYKAVTNLSSSYDSYAIDGTSFRQDVPSETLSLN